MQCKLSADYYAVPRLNQLPSWLLDTWPGWLLSLEMMVCGSPWWSARTFFSPRLLVHNDNDNDNDNDWIKLNKKILSVSKKESQFQLEAKCQEENEILQWIDPWSGNLGKKNWYFQWHLSLGEIGKGISSDNRSSYLFAMGILADVKFGEQSPNIIDEVPLQWWSHTWYLSILLHRHTIQACKKYTKSP